MTVTHPFHPWRGRRFEVIDYGWLQGKWRVDYQTTEGVRGQLPATWTDLGPKDPFAEQAQGRAIARVADLLELARITAECVKEIMPKCKANNAANSGPPIGETEVNHHE